VGRGRIGLWWSDKRQMLRIRTRSGAVFDRSRSAHPNPRSGSRSREVAADRLSRLRRHSRNDPKPWGGRANARVLTVAFARETSLGVAWIDAAALVRAPHRAGDYGRVATSVPRLMRKPRASSCRLTSAKSLDEGPSLSIVWRNRQIEAWSGVSMPSGRP
jgi:hypothetical protein